MEAQANYHYILAYKDFEYESWKSTLDNLEESLKLYRQLVPVSDSLHGANIQDRITGIEQTKQYVEYQLTEKKSAPSTKGPSGEDEKQKGERKQSTDVKGEPSEELEVQFKGNKLSMKNNEAMAIVKSIKEIERNLPPFYSKEKSTQPSSMQSNGESIFDSYLRVFDQYDDINAVLVREKKQNAASESVTKVFDELIGYFSFNKLQRTMERNIRLYENMLKRFEDEDGFTNICTKKNLKFNSAKPQEIVKYCDLVISNLRNLRDVLKEDLSNPMAQALEIAESHFIAIRCFFVSCTYINYGQDVNAVSLLEVFEQYTKGLAKIDQKEIEKSETLTSLKDQVDRFLIKTKTLKFRTVSAIVEAQEQEEKALSNQVEEMTLEQGAKGIFREVILTAGHRIKPLDVLGR